MKNVLQLARSLQKHTNRLKSLYSHSPVIQDGAAQFPITLRDGRTLEVIVREVDQFHEQRLAAEGFKPCPFCGPNCSAPELVQRDTDLRWQVVHGPCGIATGHCTTPEQAMETWNTRNRFATPQRASAGNPEDIHAGMDDFSYYSFNDSRVLSLRRQISLYHRAYRDEDLTRLVNQLAVDDATIFERSNMHGHVTTSGLVLNPECDKVLMIDHRLLGLWLQPGGHYEGNVPLAMSAMREVIEETGIHPYRVFDETPLDIDTHMIAGKRDETTHLHHDFLYLMLAQEDKPVAQEEEVLSARWVSLDEAVKISDHWTRMINKAKEFLR